METNCCGLCISEPGYNCLKTCPCHNPAQTKEGFIEEVFGGTIDILERAKAKMQLAPTSEWEKQVDQYGYIWYTEPNVEKLKSFIRSLLERETADEFVRGFQEGIRQGTENGTHAGRQAAYTEVLKVKEELKEELVDALVSMYTQYCADGHAFMSAGEYASTVLERYGYATFDEAGRLKAIIK